MTQNQDRIQKWTDADQQTVARAVVQQIREFADSRRYGSSLSAADLSDDFRNDFWDTANKVLAKWWEAGAPHPTIQGFEVLQHGAVYDHDGEAFAHFLRALVQPDVSDAI